MARIYGLNGLIRGRQGNNVFSIQNGTQVVKVYNPQVANPRTLAQREQRVKFALAGKMSGATPSDALIGLNGANPRARRARFVRMLTLRSSVSGTASDLVASVDYENVVYSEGSLAVYSTAPTITAVASGTASSRRVTVTIGGMTLSPLAPTGYGELIVAALYDAETSMLDEVQVQEREVGASMQIVFRQGFPRDCHVAVYVVPFVNEQRLARPFSVGIADSETAVTLNARSLYHLAGSNFGLSVLLGVYPVLGAVANTTMATDSTERSPMKK